MKNNYFSNIRNRNIRKYKRNKIETREEREKEQQEQQLGGQIRRLQQHNTKPKYFSIVSIIALLFVVTVIVVIATTNTSSNLFQINNAEALDQRDKIRSEDDCLLNPSLPGCSSNTPTKENRWGDYGPCAIGPGYEDSPCNTQGGDYGIGPIPPPIPPLESDTKQPKEKIKQEKQVCLKKPYLPQCS